MRSGIKGTGRSRSAVLCAVAASLLAAPEARADSLVYLKDGSVFVARPDATDPRQVTTDGGYTGVTQAHDGTIVATKGTRIYRMDHSGRLYNPPFEVLAHDGVLGAMVQKEPYEPGISPDGSLVGYSVQTFCVSPPGRPCARTQYTRPNGFSDPETFSARDETNDLDRPSFVSNSRALLFGPPSVYYHDPGSGMPPQQWFFDQTSPPQNFVDGELSPAGDRIAVVYGNNREFLDVYGVPGPIPAQPTPGCRFVGAVGGRFGDPTWIGNTNRLAWIEGDGIWTSGPIDLSNCEATTGQLTIPGATDPDWGPAEPGSNVCTTGCATSDGGGGSDGGGSDAPITQIKKHPPKKTERETAKFSFTSTIPGSTFACALTDKGRRRAAAKFRPCTSPKRYRNLDPARYAFQVRATSPAGIADSTPAKFRWQVER